MIKKSAPKTAIEWTQTTWNPTTGCTKISAGCKNCYAKVLANRLMHMGQVKYRNNFKLTLHPDDLDKPRLWKKPRLIFVNSMSDLFHKDVPIDFIKMVFSVMNETPWHTYQVLTKRAERLTEIGKELVWTPNIWMGVSVENLDVVQRVEELRNCPARVKFISAEPLIGPIPNLILEGIHWVIVGGESGRRPRPIKEEWVLDIKRQCRKFGTKFFFKQWGGTKKKLSGRMLKGKEYNEMPH